MPKRLLQTPPRLHHKTLGKIQRKIRRESKELAVEAFIENQNLFDDANRLLKVPMLVNEFETLDNVTEIENEVEEEGEVLITNKQQQSVDAEESVAKRLKLLDQSNSAVIKAGRRCSPVRHVRTSIGNSISQIETNADKASGPNSPEEQQSMPPTEGSEVTPAAGKSIVPESGQ